MESGESHCGENRPPGYIVVKEEFEDEPLELELEEDGNLRMSTLISQFSGACGLRFRNKVLQYIFVKLYNVWLGHRSNARCSIK